LKLHKDLKDREIILYEELVWYS